VKILVTGGTGFVGSHAVSVLQRSGHVVRLLARNPTKVAGVLGPSAPWPMRSWWAT